ncbi:MAG: hypothetical protein A2151_05080 [Candidatus Muproteobacteria bacterium RBG_16_65_34]|uniref:Uncharacterized protein n=1 Tax=Candidatus Muproteobacteria bacterium RBG_16_65_34 TaxID=1817760 RepID=A0A1F6TSC0_9PROT|nr:MAG: hypothetical protein A2151_05080 [Candidatus Muproteobacteria bacterium RBG_16_65_34]
MKLLPLQMVIIDLENGRRGIFIGRPLVPDSFTDEDCQVENVWFTDIREIPDYATLEQLTQMEIDQIAAKVATLQ